MLAFNQRLLLLHHILSELWSLHTFTIVLLASESLPGHYILDWCWPFYLINPSHCFTWIAFVRTIILDEIIAIFEETLRFDIDQSLLILINACFLLRYFPHDVNRVRCSAFKIAFDPLNLHLFIAGISWVVLVTLKAWLEGHTVSWFDLRE